MSKIIGNIVGISIVLLLAANLYVQLTTTDFCGYNWIDIHILGCYNK